MRKSTISNKQDATAIGYCHNKRHYGKITKEAFKEHECLKKQCKYFQMYDHCEYWISYYNDVKIKKLRRVYAKDRFYWHRRGIRIETFCQLCHNFYGTWTKVPYDKNTGKLDISEFLMHIGAIPKKEDA